MRIHRSALSASIAAAVVSSMVSAGPLVKEQTMKKARSNIRAILDKTRAYGLSGYPLGFWNYANLNQHGRYMTREEVKAWADAGFTLTQAPRFDPKKPEQVRHIRNMLEWAHESGLKLIVPDPRGWAMPGRDGKPEAVRPDYEERFRQAVADFAGCPALWGFQIGDEPDAAAKETFFRCTRIQKEIAPNLHPYGNLLPYFKGIEKRAGTTTWPEYLDEYVRKSHSDLIAYDCYTQMNDGDTGWNSYFESLRLYREAMLRNGVPFWTTLLSVGHFAYRCPNLDDVRWQFNTALACGARGIFWFFWYEREPHCNYRRAPVNEWWERTQVYSDIRLIQKNFNRRYGDLFNRLVCTRVMFDRKTYGGGEEFKPDGLISKLEGGIPTLVGEFVDGRGRSYVMLVNLSQTRSSHIHVTFPGRDVQIYSWNWDGKEVGGPAYSNCGTTRNENGITVQHFLAPGQEAVYRVASKTRNTQLPSR